MIELSSVSYEQRIKIARHCEPFFLVYKKLDILRSSYTMLDSFLTKEQSKLYEKELWTLVSATSQTVKYDNKYCQITLNKNNYPTANKITNKKISCKRMRELLTIFEDLKLLTVYKGYHFHNSVHSGIAKGMSSCIEFSSEWLSMFNILLCKKYGTARDFELVILKDDKGTILPTKGLRGIGKEKAFMKAMNNQVSSTKITIDGELVHPLYTTVFNGDLKSSGRIYGGSFSTEPSHLRSTITINDHPTCEVDYKNNHIRILYNKYGIDYQEDAYSIPLQDGWDPKEQRRLTKKAMLACLNATSRPIAIKALNLELRKGDYTTIPRKNGCSSKASHTIVDLLIERHPLIAKNHFFKGEWKMLQNIDSMMAKHVIKAFFVQGITCLPYHDSFVVESNHLNSLTVYMKEAWEMVLGDSKGFGFDIEYDSGAV